jgi:putative phosphoesterase
MRYAFISDIHSNLEALETVLSKIDALNVDEVICLGDIVGYNANPNECIDIIRKRGIRAVLGNHDTRATGIDEPTDFNPVAAIAVLWARQALTEENRRFLNGLPRTIDMDGKFLVIHGWVNNTDSYIMGNLDNPLELKPDANYLVNPGSVGQPRDGDTRASFAVLDEKDSEITFYRVEYDIESCARKVLEAGLPDILARRLKAGW